MYIKLVYGYGRKLNRLYHHILFFGTIVTIVVMRNDVNATIVLQPVTSQTSNILSSIQTPYSQ